MKFVILLVLCTAAVYADEDWTQLQHVHPEMPVNPSHTWAEWEQIFADQEVKEEEGAVYIGTEPQPDDAGVSRVDVSERIINGAAAARGQFPWQAAIVLGGTSFCGGSLISNTWVLTAAHCTRNIATFTITLGATSISSTQSGAVTQTTRNKVEHASYNPSNINNDIALLRLASAVATSSFINVIRLPRASQASTTFAGSSARVSGWGRTSSSSGISNTLNFVVVSVIANTNCAQFFGSNINAAKVCTTGVSGRSPCNGDSGGPLVVQESDGAFTEIGIVSFGSNGCLATFPAAYTRVTSFLSWISANTGIAIRA